MATEVFVYPKPVVDSDDMVGSALIVKGTTGTKLTFLQSGQTFFRTRTGRKARLVFLGNAVDAGGESVITFHVKVNNVLLPPPYESFQQAMGTTYDAETRLAVPVELPQNALVEVLCDNSTDPSSGTDYNAYARVRVEYEDLR